MSFSPSVTYSLLEKYMRHAPFAVAGPIMSSDWFYNPDEWWWKEQRKLGTLAVEMETHILYSLANKFDREALSICTVADHFDKPLQNMSSKQRETTLNKMMESLFNSLC